MDDVDRLLVQSSVDQFLYNEAALLDDGRLSEWLDLFADQCVYELYCLELSSDRRRGSRPPAATRQLLTSEDRRQLELRVRRIEQGLAGAERPPSITRRLITNVRIAPDSDDVVALSNVLIHQVRSDNDDLIAASRTDRICRTAGAWRIEHRIVVLDHTSLPRTLTVLI